MPLNMQVKLLRVLHEKVIYRVGAEQTINVNVRVVAATNRCLETAVSKGEFREDFYYRLNVFPITLPPLRERGSDIVQLFEHFAQTHALTGKKPIVLTESAQQEIITRHWPGNIRELRNLVERLSICFPGQAITSELLPSVTFAQQNKQSHLGQVAPIEFDALINNNPIQNQSHATTGALNLQESLSDIEKTYITQALNKTQGNVTQSAKILGLRRTTLIQKIKKYTKKITQ